jgi:hypothetical protein
MFGLQPFVHVELAVARAMQDGCLTKNTWEGEKDDEWVSRECYEYGECPEWGRQRISHAGMPRI